MSDLHLRRLSEDASLVHVVCDVREPSTFTFSKAAKTFLKDGRGTPLFSIEVVSWESIGFQIISFNQVYKNDIFSLARGIQCSIIDGIPTIKDVNGRRWFPLSSPRVFVLGAPH
jgi:hypothetical protein